MTLAQHRQRQARPARVWVVTLSDTRTAETDTGGARVCSLLEAAGQEVAGTCILREDNATLTPELQAVLAQPGLDAMLCTGGTGIAQRDLAYDHLQRLYDRPLPGFGELFRMLSWQEIGSAAMLSRASAGVHDGTLIFSIPGSRGAIDLAMKRLILPELQHLLGELERRDGPGAAP